MGAFTSLIKVLNGSMHIPNQGVSRMPVFVSFELFVEFALYDMYHHQS